MMKDEEIKPHEECSTVDVLVIDPVNGEFGSTDNEHDKFVPASYSQHQ